MKTVNEVEIADIVLRHLQGYETFTEFGNDMA